MKLFFKKIGEGKPLFILHGLFGSADNWQTHAKKLAEHYTVYLVDQRNHGHSPHSDVMNYDVMAEDLLELVASEGHRDITLIGHSMGGKTILRFAQEHSFLIEKMIVVDMGIKGYAPHHDLIFQGLHAVDVEHCTSRKEAEERLAPYVSDFSTQQFLLKNLYWKEPGKLAWRFNVPVLESNISKIIAGLPEGQIDAETLFIRGGQSGYILESDFADIKAKVPNSTIVTIEEAGHWIHAETPEKFIQVVWSFLDL
jgi:esterase